MNPGMCGWQAEPGLGPGSDVEFCTQVHSRSLWDGIGRTAGQEEGAWSWDWPKVSRRWRADTVPGSPGAEGHSPCNLATTHVQEPLKMHAHSDLHVSTTTLRKVAERSLVMCYLALSFITDLDKDM